MVGSWRHNTLTKRVDAQWLVEFGGANIPKATAVDGGLVPLRGY